MIFSSFEFIFLFLPITFGVYFYLNKKNLIKLATSFLVFSSLFFYSWWNVVYLPLILFSVVINFLTGKFLLKKISKKISKKMLLILGIIFNLSLLGYFKYSDFFIQNINVLFNNNYSLLNLTLPLAISFFTFQQIAYLVDNYKGFVDKQSFTNYFVFVTFFPQLIAGPIVHHKEMMPQFSNIFNKSISYQNIYFGILIFSIGLFKKVVIADGFSVWVINGFDVMQELNLIEAWITSLSYTFQLYFDFSGYTDMALGVAYLFNIKLPINFNSPYKATNIRDFWKRWHITLSRFLRDYVYISLGGNKKTDFSMYSNLMATFLIGGLWHGAGWTFVFWGSMHGFAIIIHRVWTKTEKKLNNILAWFLTFNFINLSWIFFRADDWKDAIKVIKGMFGLTNVILPSFLNEISFLKDKSLVFGDVYKNFNSDAEITLWIFIALISVLIFKNSNQFLTDYKLNNKMILFIVFIFTISLLNLEKNIEFIYFNF
jgi:D-alanyl-lipoteichoic acid acyltransferase DltB (MBOAT superfamily)